MDERCVVFYDSGIGGLNLLKRAEKAFPFENLIYFCDRKNLPYGNKSVDELRWIADKNLRKILSYSPKLIVFACNTLSCSLLEEYSTFCCRVMGVFPAVGDEKTLIVCTKRTSESEYVKGLANADVFAAEGLADEIDNSCGNGENINLESRFVNTDKRYPFVSIGCTHFLFLKEKFKKIFPQSQIIDGGDRLIVNMRNFLTTFNHSPQRGSVCFLGEQNHQLSDIYKGVSD